MPAVKPQASLGPNEVTNLMEGSVYEYLPFPATVRFAVFADTGGVVDVTIYSGTDVLLERARCDIKAAADSITIFDFQVSDVADQGERLSIQVAEAAGAAGPTLVRALVDIQPM